ncbi:hypothetical protein [Metapseudomonas resinovorans]|uniref:Uncharacterized protein n=1 Tax=Metapseudomonas resinovorans NBRC 106553 TaxID=1245471 RepID=S6ATX3_METRE|nr:hypothetical protein [Pseudomonas resinovorans]BAN47681.1 hypothetical protein PCA10_19490 [Pseudomonas resinovorans NBRC 106553]
MNHSVNSTTQHTTAFDLSDIHLALLEKRAIVVDGSVVNRKTGEIIGEYIHSQYDPEPYDYHTPTTPKELFLEIETRRFFSIDGISELAPQDQDQDQQVKLNTEESTSKNIIQFPKSKRGRPAKTVENPLAQVMQIAATNKPSWLDDFIVGGIHTGPGVINGRYSVSPADVIRVLCMSAISVQGVMQSILNHDFEPMSARQAQRLVKAASVALGGITLYLDRHPATLVQLEQEIGICGFDDVYEFCDDTPEFLIA